MSAQNPLKQFRQQHGISQFDLALLLNVSPGLIGAVEAGVPQTLPDRLTAALGAYLSPEEVLEFFDDYTVWRAAAREALKIHVNQRA